MWFGASLVYSTDRNPSGTAMVMKAVVIVMLLAIFASLFSGLVFLFKDQGRGTRTARALTWRVGLSLALFVLLMAAFHFGLIPSQGISARTP